MTYCFVAVLLIVLAIHYDINGKTKDREFWFRGVLLILILIAGLRYRLGVDTPRYIYHFYYFVPTIDKLTLDDFSIGSDPFFMLINSIVKSLGLKFYVVQLIHSTFVNFLLFKYIKRHSIYIFTCVFFYFIYSYLAYTMEEMRASMAVVVCLYANDYVLDKKWIKGALLYIVASLFHFSAVVLIVSPLLLWLKFNKIGITIIVLSFVASIILKPMIDEYIQLLEFSEKLQGKVDEYLGSEAMEGISLSIFGIIGNIIIYIFPVYYLYMMNKKKVKDHIIILEPFFVISLISVCLVYNIKIMYRYQHFYAIYLIFLYSHVSIYFFKKNTCGLSISLVRLRGVLLIFLMLFFLLKENFNELLYTRYYPYSSVIERNIDLRRERTFNYFEVHRVSYDKY